MLQWCMLYAPKASAALLHISWASLPLTNKKQYNVLNNQVVDLLGAPPHIVLQLVAMQPKNMRPDTTHDMHVSQNIKLFTYMPQAAQSHTPTAVTFALVQ
jgi:hypothetical protein